MQLITYLRGEHFLFVAFWLTETCQAYIADSKYLY